MNPEEIELWEAYKANPSKAIEGKLVKQYDGIIRYILNRRKFPFTKLLDEDDKIQLGLLGLIKAIRRFDSTRGQKFTTYAIYRVSGSIFDECRKYTMFSRGDFRKKEDVNKEDDPRYLQACNMYNACDINYENIDYLSSKSIEDSEFTDNPLGHIFELMGRLPKKYYLPFYRYYVEGIGMRIIGSMMGVSESRVSQLVCEAKGLIKKYHEQTKLIEA